MRLTQVTIENFRCFEHMEMDLDPHLNVIVGNNGSGKTSVLDAIVIGLFAEGAGNSRIEFANVDDLRVDAQGPTNVAIDADDFVHSVELLQLDGEEGWGLWGRRLSTNQFGELVRAYYRASRGGRDLVKQPSQPMESAGWFDASSGYQESERWFYDREVEELRLKNELEDLSITLAPLDAVRNAISRHVVPQAKSIRFTSRPPHVLKVNWRENGDSQSLAVSQLSDGYKNMLALVMDFARRLAEANPHLDNPLDAEAILLIDEIELHLHPKWQQTVLGDLRKTFPNTQIIVSTHSPQVLTTVESKHIRILKDGKVFAAPPATYGAEASRLLETVLGVPVRPPNNENADNIAKVHNLIIEGKIEEAERLLEKLREWSQGEEPAVVEAEMAIENKKWEAEIDG
jgi:predicted ATP-binding protein involved in virulence